MKYKKCIFCCLFLLISLCSTASADVWTLWTSDLFVGGLGVPYTEWYDVAEWETKVCFDWGGDSDPNQISNEQLSVDIFHDLVVTIQAQVSNPLPGDIGFDTDELLYEISWFIQPVTGGEDMTYEVYLMDDMSASQLLDTDSATYERPGRGYFAEYSSHNYTKAKIKYINPRTDDELEVRVIG
ncbi:hypothetical protein HQ545_07365 [Candidatus Woesearchaeota archaeon]|nr:hypothetical protein [Candidatus Woesearchaeota archaeon]